VLATVGPDVDFGDALRIQRTRWRADFIEDGSKVVERKNGKLFEDGESTLKKKWFYEF